jgi:FkbM family methyltransferase
MFSQYNEELIIKDYFSGYTGKFLDIGAGNGLEFSNTRALALSGWCGCLVEPLYVFFAALFEVYKDEPNFILINAAVTADGRPLTFTNNLFLSTGSELQAKRCEAKNGRLYRYNIASMSVSDLVKIAGCSFDFVSIDIEGMDEEVFANAQCLLKDTKLLCYETEMPLGDCNGHADILRGLVRDLGFKRVIGETAGNTLIARD